ncbi:response regulator [Fibrobacterales bacterium]|nr:response regulator [Fibrobacterales bacterium]
MSQNSAYTDKTIIKKSIILAVDDSPVLLDALDICIGQYCQELIMATSGAQALEFAVKKLPDLILLDVEMPEMNGFETFKKLKTIPSIAHIPVIFLTVSDEHKIEVKALESGAVDYITKPFDKTVLLHRINLHLSMQRNRINLENSLRSVENGLIDTFTSLLESRDRNTSGHARRTGVYMEILCQEMLSVGEFKDQLNESIVQKMVQAAPLHDIGKIGIPDGILLKEGHFNEAEFEIMKSHASEGSRVLRNLYAQMPSQQYLMFAEQIARSHHERWDGTGYPFGIKQTQIPLSARIMAIADVYDACTKRRIYRDKMTHDEAVKIILEGKGTLYDPKVVDIFERVLNKFKSISEQKEENFYAH